MLKSMLDKKTKAKARGLLLKAAADAGLDIQSEMTDNIDAKLDDLLQAIIDDVGYIKLAKMGLK